MDTPRIKIWRTNYIKMLSILNQMYSRVTENQLIAKPGEMLNIAREVYRLSRAEKTDEPSLPESSSKIQFLEDCYLAAVKKVTQNDDEALNKRWDVQILSSGVQRVNNISQKCQNVTTTIKQKVDRLNERVRWTGRAFNEQLRRKAKSCDKIRKGVYRRFRSQQKRAVRAYKFTRELATESFEKTRKKTVELRLKLHKKVDSLVVAPAKQFSHACSNRVKPFYDSAKDRMGNFVSHSNQAASDLKNVFVETALEYSKPLRDRTVNVLMPRVSEGIEQVKGKLVMSRKVVVRKMEPVTQTLLKNKSSMLRSIVFSWEMLKDVVTENARLAKQVLDCNKSYMQRYFGDIDLEVYYGENKSLSLREVVAFWVEAIFTRNKKNKELAIEDSVKSLQTEFSEDVEIESLENYEQSEKEDSQIESKQTIPEKEKMVDSSNVEVKSNEVKKNEKEMVEYQNLD